jgi:PAS domain S-box-containing protein
MENGNNVNTGEGKSLKGHEELFITLVDRMLDAVGIIGWDGTIKFINRAGAKLIGLEATSDCIGRNVFEFIHPESVTSVVRDIELIKEGKRGGSTDYRVYRVRTAAGEEKWVEGIGTKIMFEGASADLITIRDVTKRMHIEEELKHHHDNLENLAEERTAEMRKINKRLRAEIAERKQTEKSLRESEERYKSVIENIGIGVSLISPDMEILNLNTQMRKWYPDIDISTRPVCYKSFNNPPREEVCSYCPTYKTLKDGRLHESVTETPSGSEIKNYRIISSPIMDRNGNVVAAIEMVEDITEKRKIQEALSESENRYRTIFETTAAATMIVEEDTTISLVNTELEKKSGYSKAELEGKRSWTEFVHPDDVEKMREYHHLRRIDQDAAPRNYEFRFIGREGDIRDVYMTVAMIPGTKKSVASFLDITERKRAEEALKRRERELEVKSHNLEELNTALKVLLKQREKDKEELEGRVLSNVRQLVLPYMEKLKKSSLDPDIMTCINIIETNLQDVTSPFSQRLSSKYLNFTPKELQIANLIKEGKTTKEIAELLNTSTGTIDFHRNNIRNKLDLKKKKANLRSYLLTLT